VNHEFAFSHEDFGRVRQMIASYAGIALHAQKWNMVYNRLVRRLRAIGARDFRDYLDRVEMPGSEEKERFVNALTTNLTSFFREPHHFDSIARLAKGRSGGLLRVWSCACSTGEEAYSAAMVLREAGRAAEILATDIDTDAIAAARKGIYRTEALERVGAERARRHFLKGMGDNAGCMLVRPELRAMVKFGLRNLLAGDWPAHERYDAILCRNVMIYFDRATQLQVLNRLAAALLPGGILFLGHSESCASGHPAFKSCGRTEYERRRASPA